MFINAWSGEGPDRIELRNTEQDALVTGVASEFNNTVVIVNTVGARILDTWVENENVTAILYGGLLGQESGNSLMDVIYGDVCTYTHRCNSTMAGFHCPIIKASNQSTGQPIRKTHTHNRQKRIRLHRPLHNPHLQFHRRKPHRLRVLRSPQHHTTLRIRLRPQLHHIHLHQPKHNHHQLHRPKHQIPHRNPQRRRKRRPLVRNRTSLFQPGKSRLLGGPRVRAAVRPVSGRGAGAGAAIKGVVRGL